MFQNKQYFFHSLVKTFVYSHDFKSDLNIDLGEKKNLFYCILSTEASELCSSKDI